MKQYCLGVFVLVGLALVGCNKKGDSSAAASTFQAISAPFLGDADFSSTNENYMVQGNVSQEMSGQDDLWHYKASTSTNTSLDSCLSNFKIKLKASDTFYIGGSEDITACAATQMSGSGMTLNKFTMKMYMEVQCVGIDLSQYDGQAATSVLLQQIDSSCGTATASVLSNSTVELDMTVTVFGSPIHSSTIQHSATMTSAGTGCTGSFDGTNWIRPSGCTHYSKTHYVSGSNGLDGKDEISKITDNNLVMSNVKTDPFYVSGTKNVYLKGWQGTVTYNGVNADATWSMTKDSVTQTGALTVPVVVQNDSSTSLIQELSRVFNQLL